MKPERGYCLKVQLSRKYIYGIFFFCSFLNILKQELIKLILIMSLKMIVIVILSVLHNCKSLHKETLPVFEGQF